MSMLMRGRLSWQSICIGAETPNIPMAADVAPLFTDFTAKYIGLPKNLALPYYCENKPDQFGFTANPMGFNFVDLGLGGYLNGTGAAPNPNTLQWKQLAPLFNGMFQTATLRNVDKRPRPDFVKEYMHNGYLKSLKEVVHFYNTSQALPHCAQVRRARRSLAGRRPSSRARSIRPSGATWA